MPAFSRRHLLACGLALGASRLAHAAPAQSDIVFGVITPRAAEQMKESWRPFIERLSQALKLEVELRAFAESAELVASFRRGEIDLAWMGNAPALDVVESGVGAVFAQGITMDGSVGYNSVLVVPDTSSQRSLNDVIAHAKTLRFGDGDLKSTSGHLVPYYFAFQKNGINDVHALFKSVSNASHQKNLTMVAKGEVDVATANNEELQFFAHDAPALAQRVKVIWESPLIPQSPLLWRVSLPLELRRRVQAFVVNFGRDPAEKQVLRQLNNLSGFRQSNNRQLVSVADIEMFRARQAINNDESLAPQERSKRIQEVIQRGSHLDLLLKLSSASVR